MFTFTDRGHKQIKPFNTQQCKFYWTNETELYIFVFYVANERGTIQKQNIYMCLSMMYLSITKVCVEK